MRRRTLLVALALIAAMIGAGVRPAAAETKESATAVFGNCLSQQRAGDLLLLMDESASLKDNDQPNDRVRAAKDLIDQLAATTRTAKIDLSVAVARFSDTYERTLPWTSLTDGSASVDRELDAYAQRNTGVQTDYWTGLNGARKELAARGSDRCQAIVWFSDGDLDVVLSQQQWDDHPDARDKPYAPDADLRDQGQADRAEQAALRDLCRPGGLADQLRRSRVTLFAVGLDRTGDLDFAPMRGIATGSKVGGSGCGRRTDPTPGSFTSARNIDDLIFAFRSIVHPGTPSKGEVCPTTNLERCRKRGHTFVLDNSLTAVHVDAKTPVANGTAYLRAPDGSWTELRRNRRVDLEPNGSRYAWATERILGIDLVNPQRRAKPWTGVWTLVFVKKGGSGTSLANIDVSGNLFPAWPGREKAALYAGQSQRLQLGLADETGRAVDAGQLLGTGTLDARLTGVDGGSIAQRSIPAKRVDDQPFTVDLASAAAGPATLTLRLDITTARSGSTPGTALTPRVLRIPVQILPPKGVGGPQPARLDFGSITGPVDAEASLTVVGPACVWRDPGQALQAVEGPEGLGTVAITASPSAAGSCLKVAEGAQQTLPVRLTTEQAGNGTLAGTVPFTVASLDQPDKQTVVQVEFRADLAKPLRTVDFLITLLVALLLGIGLPWALLALAKWATAKIPGRALMVQPVPVRVEGDQVLRDGVPLALRDTDFRTMVPLKNRGSRRTETAGLSLSTHTGWSPFGAGYVLAQAPGRVALSSTHPEPYGNDDAARLPLAVHNTWVAVKDPAAGAGEVQLVMFADLDSGEGRQRVVDDVRRRLPELLPRLETGGGRPPSTPPPSTPPPDHRPAERETFTFDFDDEG